MNGFDRVVNGEVNWLHGHCSLPPTSEEYAASLRLDLKKLQDAISMSAESTVTRPSDSLEELLANFEFARIKWYMEKRSREAAQVQVTVTPVDTVQYYSPCSPDPKPSPHVRVNLENNEGRMGPELGELESPSAGTDLKTPGQQFPPNEGIWEQERTTANGFLTAGVDSSQGRNISLPTTESISVDTQASTESTATLADTSSPKEHAVGTLAATAATPQNRRRKTSSKQNKQFDPGGKGEKAPPWNAAVPLLFFFWGELGGFLFVLCASCFVSPLCVPVFPKLLIYPGDTSQQAERHEGRHGSSR